MGLIAWLKRKFSKPVYHEVISVKEEKKPDEKELLLKELHNLNLHPAHNITLGNLSVDFAFPKEKLVVQILGNYNQERKEQDRKKFLNLKSFGWSVYGFQVYSGSDLKDIALKIKKLISYHKNPR